MVGKGWRVPVNPVESLSDLVQRVRTVEIERERLLQIVDSIQATLALNFTPAHRTTDGISLQKLDDPFAMMVDVLKQYHELVKSLNAKIAELEKQNPTAAEPPKFESGQSWIDRTGRYVKLYNRVDAADAWMADEICGFVKPMVLVFESDLVTLL
jgi:hypothetical protein